MGRTLKDAGANIFNKIQDLKHNAVLGIVIIHANPVCLLTIGAGFDVVKYGFAQDNLTGVHASLQRAFPCGR